MMTGGSTSCSVRGVVLGAILLAFTGGVCSAQPPDGGPLFETDVAPILKIHCLKCHEGDMPKGGLSVATAAALVKGGDSGPAVVAGRAGESLLVELLTNGQMPPEDESRPSPGQISAVTRWVASGAHSREPIAAAPITAAPPAAASEFWAFQPLKEPSVPAYADGATAIDALVHRPLAERGLDFSPAADRRTLLRRASFDLTGLPPTPQELETFLSDERPDAYQRLVDRLLASPHFGERWGRHWLDAAGYSDITGGDNDAGIIKFSEGKWKYRDYVVRALNADKPFEQFIIEQLAGDELVDWRVAASFTPQIEQSLVATGFLRNAADDTDEKELTTPDILNGVLQRTSEVVASNLLGLTVHCAKCHDHKYEPISQRDYYRLLAAFTPSLNPASWVPPKRRMLADIAPAEKAAAERQNAELDRQTAQLRSDQSAVRLPYVKQLRAQKLASVPETIRADVLAAIETPTDQRTEVQKYLAKKFEDEVKVPADEVSPLLTDGEKLRVAQLESNIRQLEATRRTWGAIQAVYDVGPPPETHLLRRGNHETPGPVVQPGFLSALLAGGDHPGLATARLDGLVLKPQGESSGRRLALACWLTDWRAPAGGLVARVWVNRIWQHLFGRGIVETTENLGVSGTPPTHPELLEWLACQFVSQGRQLKPLLKCIVTSKVYRQTSAADHSDAVERYRDSARIDPANQWLWRMPIKRLESEIVRDAILASSGRLDRTLGGPPLELESKPDGSVVVKQSQAHPTATSRRSLYVLARRNYHLSMLNVFDQPAMSTNCLRRQQSAVVLQSLAMLNDGQVLVEAEAFAQRVMRSAPNDAEPAKVNLIFEIALGRAPTPAEQSSSEAFLAAHAAEESQTGASAEQAAGTALVHLCHMVLNSNEFLYVP
jgi:hypothetical protein